VVGATAGAGVPMFTKTTDVVELLVAVEQDEMMTSVIKSGARRMSRRYQPDCETHVT